MKKSIGGEFDGTAIIVSHDRDFLDGLVTKVYEFGNGRVLEHLGGIYDFLSKKRLESLKQLEVNHANTPKPEEKQAQPSESKLSYQEQKEQNRKQRKLERQIEEAESRIELLEKKNLYDGNRVGNTGRCIERRNATGLSRH